MAYPLSYWTSRVARFAGLLVLVLAVAGQVSAGALALAKQPTDSPRAALHAAMVLCLGSNHPQKDGPLPVHHRLPDLAIAAECHHFVQHAALIDGEGALPPPPPSLAFWTGVPEARGPPPRFAAAAYPTGPPPTLI